MKNLLIIFCLTLMPSLAFAAGDQGPKQAGDLVVYWINFAIYSAAMVYLVRKFFPEIWTSRREKILGAINQAKAELNSANELLAEAEKKHASVTADCARIETTIDEEGSIEAKKVVENAGIRATEIISRSKETAKAEKLRAEQGLRRELSDEVLSKAEAILKSKIDAGSDSQRRKSAVSESKGLFH